MRPWTFLSQPEAGAMLVASAPDPVCLLGSLSGNTPGVAPNPRLPKLSCFAMKGEAGDKTPESGELPLSTEISNRQVAFPPLIWPGQGCFARYFSAR